MNNKFNVSLEAARLLKEKGYDGDAEYAYHENGNFSHWGRNVNDIDYLYAAPTKAEAIDWLESKGMCIIVFRRTVDNKVEWRYVIHGYTEIISGFQTRLEAKDAAIINACKLLENGN